MPIKVSKPEEKITIDDVYELTSLGRMQWREVEPSGLYPWFTLRSLYKGRLYILRKTRMEVFNAKTDAIIWFEKDASKLRLMIQRMYNINLI